MPVPDGGCADNLAERAAVPRLGPGHPAGRDSQFRHTDERVDTARAKCDGQVMSSSSLTPADLARYSRHLSLREVGVEGQQKLKAAKVLLVGAGGLGSPA